MRIPGMPAPWNGGKTTLQMERELSQLKIRQDANVTLDEDSAYSANDHDFVRIPEMDVRLAAGKLGFENYHETQKGEIMFRRSFLESFGLPIPRMSVLYGDGPSMKPVIGDGSPMLFFEDIITDLRQIRPYIVYAINRGGEMLVKCLSRERGGQWLAKSTNREHKPFPIALEDGRDVRIVGQILWSPYDLRNGVDPRLL
ncbi:LexA family transcriptional repressor [Achromobacter sp. HZ28]|nr:LexA family transcriptional repressor [Achromobacter sp. HZ34]OWT70676.1 LexA family transcriptional repressor [Achromobacter sp. HZ28]